MVNKQEITERFSVKIGTQEIFLDIDSPIEKMFFELVADHVNKKFNEVKQYQVDTMRSYAYTSLEIAKEKFNLEKKAEEKVINLELKINSLIEEISKYLEENPNN
ncbi:MAG: hypothetical protein RMJ67_00140 [Elusimicrobiota bacterium]|nr:hypothetical protein [Endomicrobiia bacterium]MCX7910700.1 hypothetical protein [Endomicrobiia bacterium]MDW8164909.1 hypothetical protein [Elusimicrobiota bacterium]